MQEAFILQCGRSRIYAPRRCKADGRLWEGCGLGMPGPYRRFVGSGLDRSGKPGGGCARPGGVKTPPYNAVITALRRLESAAPRLRPSWPSWCIRARRCGACRACPCGSWRRSRPACCTTRRAGQRTAGSSGSRAAPCSPLPQRRRGCAGPARRLFSPS